MNCFEDQTIKHKRSLPGNNPMRNIMSCKVCFNTSFEDYDAGQIRCKKCGQIYYV